MSPRTPAEPTPVRPLPPGLRIREIRPGDGDELERLFGGLTLEARERRFFTGAVDLDQAVAWAAHPERVDAFGLIAEAEAEAAGDGDGDGNGTIAGHGVLVPIDETTAEVAFEVAEAWRHRGVAGALLRALEEEARRRGLTRLVAEVLSRNGDMLAVFREHGPVRETVSGTTIHVDMPVTDALAVAQPRPCVGKIRSAARDRPGGQGAGRDGG